MADGKAKLPFSSMPPSGEIAAGHDLAPRRGIERVCFYLLHLTVSIRSAHPTVSQSKQAELQLPRAPQAAVAQSQSNPLYF